MGGVGKTELALQYAWQYQNGYPLGVCWLDGRAGEPQIEFTRFAAVFWGVKAPDGLTPIEQLEYIRRNLPQGTALIVLDDYPGEFPEILRGLPEGFRLLLTTREDPGQGFQTLPLAVLSPGAALALLGKLLGDDNRIATQLADAEKLCDWLGFLPLALELVGNFLRPRPDLNLARMRERLEDKSINHASLAVDAGNGIRTSKHFSIWAALELSRELLSERGLELAFLLSQLGQAKIPLRLIEAIAERFAGEEYDEEVWEDSRTELLQLSLLERPDEDFYRLHPLVREFFQWLLEGEQAESMRRAVAFCLTREARKIPGAVTLMQAEARADLVPHWEWACKDLTDALEEDDLVWPFVALTRYYQLYNQLELALHYNKACLAVCESVLGAEHPDTAMSLNNLAGLYESQGNYDAALPLYERALAICENVLGAEHPHTATSLNNLALLYQSQGNYDAVLPLYERALAIREKVLGAEHLDTATSLNNLAGLYYSQGNYDAALPLYERALAIYEKVLGAEHPDTAMSLNNLALLYQSQGSDDAALPLYERALAISEKVLGAEHPDTATSLNNLAALHQSQGNYDSALPLFERALAICEKVLGVDHPNTITARNNLEFIKAQMQ